MDINTYRKLDGEAKEKWHSFMSDAGLCVSDDADFTVIISDNGDIVSSASRCGNVLKYFAVSPSMQGQNLTAKLITALSMDAFENGIHHLFVYTKPENGILFESSLFYKVSESSRVLLMENEKGGIDKFLSSQPAVYSSGLTGAVVMNCNPFTLGHRYLIEKALERCDNLYVFVLCEDSSPIPAADRLSLVMEGTADLDNVTVYRTGDYLISSATFPDYFLKEKTDATDAQCELDTTVFAGHFAPYYNIGIRFFGTEPDSDVTARYNTVAKKLLPAYGIGCTEIPRLTDGSGRPVSAGEVRRLLNKNRPEEIKKLVPESTFAYLSRRGLI